MLKKLFKKYIIPMIVIFLFIAGVALILKVSLDEGPKEIYEVAVMVKDQNNSNSDEDMSTSMKKGDVLVIKKEGQNWSRTELVTYLILKIELSEEQRQKLTQAQTEEVNRSKTTDKELEGLSSEQKKEFIEPRKEPEMKTIRPREYRIDMRKFKDFTPIDLLNIGQPYFEEVYDWGIVEKKK